MKHWRKIAFSGVSILLLAYLGLRQPQWMFALVAKLQPGAVFFVDTEAPVIALTIDDGPHVKTTAAILSVLERYGAKATFFMLSDAIATHEATIQELVSSGHELGNHMTADESSLGLTPEDFRTKFIIADRALSTYGRVRWFRPGMGWYNARILNLATANGYQLVLGSLFPYDTHIPSVRFAQWFVLNNLESGDIMVLHDGPGHGERTVKLLELLLPQIQQRGYRIVTLSELQTYEK
ncbi:MAG: chitin deacetylase family protein [Leptolyngbyaceae cyanobacterium]